MADNYVTVAGAGAKTGVDWDNAFGMAEFISDVASAAAGDFYYVMEGTYTHASNISCSLGVYNNRLFLVGVKSGTTAEPPTASDFATGTARPYFTATGYNVTFGAYWKMFNIRIQNDISASCYIGEGSVLRNSSVISVGESNFYHAVQLTGPNTIIIDCHLEALGQAVRSDDNTTDYCMFIASYFKGEKGIVAGGMIDYQIVMNCIFDSITLAAIDVAWGNGLRAIGNTFYACGTGIAGTTAHSLVIMNNIFSDCTDGMKFTSTLSQQVVDYNNYYNNGTDVTGIVKGTNALAVNPQFTDAAGGDFSLNAASALIGAGFGIQLGVS
jgi:hypothetical protein